MKKIVVLSIAALLLIAARCHADSYGIFDPNNALTSKAIKDFPVLRPDLSQDKRKSYEQKAEALSEECRKKLAHELHWFARYPYYDVLFPSRGKEYAQACDKTIDLYFAPQLQNIKGPAEQLIAEGTRIKKAGDDMIANGQAKKTEGNNLLTQAAETEKTARELIKDGNAIKGKGERMYAAGDVDEAKQFLNEGARRINTGNEKLNEIAKMTERAQALINEGTKLLTEGEAQSRNGQNKINEGNQQLLQIEPLKAEIVLLKQASRLFRDQDPFTA